MIRPTGPADTPALVELALATGVFKPGELVALREVLDDYHAHEHSQGHRSITLERNGRVVGFAYYAPSAMADRVWYLWWIAVEPGGQSKGLGTEMLRRAEADARAADARLMLIETSSLPHYEPTRQFYMRRGYNLYAVLEDYYADGDAMVVFARRLTPKTAAPDGAPPT
ncbi:MAG: GNAT family N-acetyltransferase [Isosphaeraceae bacterium]